MHRKGGLEASPPFEVTIRAILDRSQHHAETITITGKSYRLKARSASEPTCKEETQ